jgi:hypothetical protein
MLVFKQLFTFCKVHSSNKERGRNKHVDKIWLQKSNLNVDY